MGPLVSIGDHEQTRRSVLKTTATGLSGGLLAGCLGGQNGSAGGELSKTTVDVALTFPPSQPFSPFYAARELGYFDEVGLEVNVEWNYGTNPLQILREYDIIAVNATTYLIGRARNVPSGIVLSSIGNTPQSYVSLKDKGITSFSDFPGRTIGIQNAPDMKMFTQHFLNSNLSESEREDVNQVFVGYDLTNLLSDKVDALTSFHIQDPVLSLLVTGAEEFNFIDFKDYLNIPGQVWLANGSLLEDHNDTVVEYARAHGKALLDSLNMENQQEYVDIILDVQEENDLMGRYINDADPRAVANLSYELMAERYRSYKWDENGVGWTSPDILMQIQDIAVNSGIINEGAALSRSEIGPNSIINQITDENANLEWPN